MDRFLWADPTTSALQVFERVAGRADADRLDLSPEQARSGVWIDADPIPGCVVCNIGESEWAANN